MRPGTPWRGEQASRVVSSSELTECPWPGVVIWRRDPPTPPGRSRAASGTSGVKQRNHPGGAVYQPRTSTTTLAVPAPFAIEMVPFEESFATTRLALTSPVLRLRSEVGGSLGPGNTVRGVLGWGDSREIDDDRSGVGWHSGQSGHVERQGSALADGLTGAHVGRALGSGVTDAHWCSFGIELGSGPGRRRKISRNINNHIG